MTLVGDILDVRELRHMMDEKRIQQQVHPTLPLYILNYTNRAQFAGEWTNSERVCRGLIADFGGKIIARGPSKFFNYGQPGAPEVALDDEVYVTRKEDGSLGIGWYYKGEYGVATRGSFASDQALHATELLSKTDKTWIKTLSEDGMSRIWEIVYPDNHIVLHYGNRDELIPLGAVNNKSGIIEQRSLVVMPSLEPIKFVEAVAMPIPDDEEGYVLDIVKNDKIVGHLKLKGTRYKELHAATFQLSERKIWEAMGRGEDMVKFVSDLPDEIMPWAQGVVDRLNSEIGMYFLRVANSWAKTLEHFNANPRDVPRGDVARYWAENFKDITGPLFSMLDERDGVVFEWAHKQVRPEHKLFRVEDENAN